MQSKTYKAFYADFECGQGDRIVKGFRSLGGSQSDTPDFIYSNDVGHHQEAINFKNNESPESKLILNVLDLPIHILHNGWNPEETRSLLIQADIITCISKFVQSQIKEFYNLDSHVIYNPIMEIYPDFPDDKYSKYEYAILGRSNDPNKRTQLAKEALAKLQARNDQVICVGSENPNFGQYHGVLSRKQLHKLYNSVRFVFCLGKIEGLSLQPFECLAGGSCIPIILNDCSIYEEMWGNCRDLININPDSDSIVNFIVKNRNYDNFEDVSSKLRERQSPFIKQNLTGERVAQKIIDLF